MELDFDWNLYKTFYFTAKSKSFSDAADKLFMSQPAISSSIKRLEDHLNTKLFYRKPHGIALTADGNELLYYVEKTYNILISGNRNLQESKDFMHGKISIGVQSHIGRYFLFPYIEKFHIKYPNIEINVISRNTKTMVEFLENSRIDIMIDTSPIESIYNNLKIRPLCDIESCFISKERIINNFVKIEDLKKYNLILPVKKSTPRKEFDKYCSKLGVNINPIITIETTEMLIDAVKKNMGIGYVWSEAVSKEIENGQLFKINVKEELPKLKLNIVYIEEYLTNIPRTFMETIIKDYEDDI